MIWIKNKLNRIRARLIKNNKVIIFLELIKPLIKLRSSHFLKLAIKLSQVFSNRNSVFSSKPYFSKNFSIIFTFLMTYFISKSCSYLFFPCSYTYQSYDYSKLKQNLQIYWKLENKKILIAWNLVNLIGLTHYNYFIYSSERSSEFFVL